MYAGAQRQHHTSAKQSGTIKSWQDKRNSRKRRAVPMNAFLDSKNELCSSRPRSKSSQASSITVSGSLRQFARQTQPAS